MESQPSPTTITTVDDMLVPLAASPLSPANDSYTFDFLADLNELMSNGIAPSEVQKSSWPSHLDRNTPIALVTKDNLQSVIESRLAYTLEQLKTAPMLMVSENGTPWSHPLLYKDQMPASMRDAHAACALYAARNDTNSAFVWRHIETRAEQLLSVPRPTDPMEQLAYIQALMLYQTMRVFGGGVSNGTVQLLESLLTELF